MIFKKNLTNQYYVVGAPYEYKTESFNSFSVDEKIPAKWTPSSAPFSSAYRPIQADLAKEVDVEATKEDTDRVETKADKVLQKDSDNNTVTESTAADNNNAFLYNNTQR